MHVQPGWHEAIEAARRGDPDAADRMRRDDPTGVMADYFFARCRAEAGLELEDAIDRLRVVTGAEPRNRIFRQTLALALLRRGRPDDLHQVLQIWKMLGLPHATDLLGSVALALEAHLRPRCAEPAAEFPWPQTLADPSDLVHESASEEPVATPCSRRLRRTVRMMEQWIQEHKNEKVLNHALLMLGQRLQNAEMHLAAGIAAEELDLIARARAHLVQALRMDPSMVLGQLFLGRVYWRLGWLDMAEALWRNLPVEGPYDNGRHYHLALAHDAAGDRPAAVRAMDVALTGFFYDTRHFFIQRARQRLARVLEPASSSSGPTSPTTAESTPGAPRQMFREQG